MQGKHYTCCAITPAPKSGTFYGFVHAFESWQYGQHYQKPWLFLFMWLTMLFSFGKAGMGSWGGGEELSHTRWCLRDQGGWFCVGCMQGKCLIHCTISPGSYCCSLILCHPCPPTQGDIRLWPGTNLHVPMLRRVTGKEVGPLAHEGSWAQE